MLTCGRYEDGLLKKRATAVELEQTLAPSDRWDGVGEAGDLSVKKGVEGRVV